MTDQQPPSPPDPPSPPSPPWLLRLYVAGHTPRSVRAAGNLRAICEQYLPGRYRIEMVDLIDDPGLARQDQVVAIPTLVRKLPEPVRRLIGDLADTERVLRGLEIRTVEEES